MATELATAYVQIIPSMKDIKSNITEELEGIVTSADKAENALNSVGTTAGDVGLDLDSLGNDANDTSGDLDTLGDDAGTAGDDLDSLANDAVSAGGNVETLGDAAGDAVGDINELGDSADSTGDSLDTLNTTVDVNTKAAEISLDGLADSADNAGSSLDELSSIGVDIDVDYSALDEIVSAADDAAGSLEDVAGAADIAGFSLNELSSIGVDIDIDYSALDEIVSAADEAANSLEGIDDAIDDVDFSNIDDAAESVETLGDSAGSALGDISDLGSELGGTLTSGSNDASRAYDSVNNVFDAFLAGGIGAGVAAGLGEIVEGLTDLILAAQDSQAIIAQATGASGQDLEQYKDVAKAALKEVALASETDLDTVSGVVGELATRFRDLSEDELTEATVKMSDFAAITGQDAVSATSAVASAMKSWGMDTSELNGFLDELTVASQSSGISATELASSLQKDSEQFQTLGYSTSDALALLADYGSVEGSTSQLTTALTRATTNLNGEVDDVPGAFQLALSSIAEADSSLDALNAQVGDTGLTVEDVFGNRVVQNIYSGVHYGASDLEYFQSALSEASGAIEQTADDSVTFRDTLQSGMNDAKIAVMDTGEALTNGVSQAAESMGALGAAYGYSLSNYLPEVEESATELGETAVECVKEAEPEMETVGEETGESYAEGLDTMPGAVGEVMDETVAEIDEFGDESSSAMESAASGVADTVDSVYSGIPSAVDSALNSAESEIDSFGSSSVSSVADSSSSVVSTINSEYSNIPSTVQSPLASAMSNTTSWGADEKAAASDMAKTFVSNTKSGMSSIGDTVSAQLAKATTQIKSWQTMMKTKATAIGTAFTNNVISAMSSLGSQVSSILSSVTSTVNSYSSSFSSAGSSVGSSLVQGMINGINSKSGSLYSTISSVVSTAVSKANSAAGTGSPSRYLAWTGRMMDEGLALGLSDYAYKVDNAMNDVMSIVDASGSMEFNGNAVGGTNTNGRVINITQNIYSQAQTAAALMRESRREAQRAVMQGV